MRLHHLMRCVTGIRRDDDNVSRCAKSGGGAQRGHLGMIFPSNTQIAAEIEALTPQPWWRFCKSTQGQIGLAGFELCFEMSGIERNGVKAKLRARPRHSAH